jgi:hypothetical protein
MTETHRTTVTFIIAKWYGYVLSATFLLYGGVKIVLSFLDRTYADMASSAFFLILGIMLISVAFAYRDRKAWAWYGELAINAIIAVVSVFQLRTHSESIVLLILSAVILALLLAPPTKEVVFKGR